MVSKSPENHPLKSALAKVGKEQLFRDAADHPRDPLFMPHFELLEMSVEGLDSGDAYRFFLESICGAVDDSQPVEQYDGTLGVTAAFVAAHQRPACQVQWNANLAAVFTNPGNVSGSPLGSGTMISDDLFLTCGHLFDQSGGGWNRPRQNGTSNIINPADIARNMHLNFNYQADPSGTLRAEQSFPILELLEYRLGGIDMAICRIDGNPGAIFGRTQVATNDAVKGDMLCILGHPAGVPKRVEAGPTFDIQGHEIHYDDIDTLGGNSGSGILRANDGRLVGVHTNGGCNAAGTGSNFGQRIEAIIAVSPILQNLTRPSLKATDDKSAITLKFRDDRKFKFQDDTKFKFQDDRKFKFIDDVKHPVLDKGFDKGFDLRDPISGPGSFQPGGISGARPFILQIPHHSEAYRGQAQAQSEVAELEQMLMQLEQQLSAGYAELAQLEAQYRELCAVYNAAMGGGGGAGR